MQGAFLAFITLDLERAKNGIFSREQGIGGTI